MTAVTKMSCQQLIECGETKDLKLKELFSVDKEVFRYEKKILDRE